MAIVDFDPDRCAALHNEILRYAISLLVPTPPEDQAPRVQRDLILRMREQLPEVAAWMLDQDPESTNEETENGDTVPPEQRKIYRFLSQLDCYASEDIPLTAEYHQPRPGCFFNETYDEFEDRDIILLYPDHIREPATDGGLYLDLHTFLVTWGRMDIRELPPDDSPAWIPLETALTQALNLWKSGKHVYNSERSELVFVPWIPRDVQDTLEAWDDLCNAISDCIPRPSSTETTTQSPSPLEPLPLSLMDGYDISSFSKAFLSQANRPSFKHIAPGLTTFTPESFAALMDAEPGDSPRRRYIANLPRQERGYNTPSLVLPSTGDRVPQLPPSDRISLLARERKAIARFLINDQPGLYSDPIQGDLFADGTLLITDNGRRNPFEFVCDCPWGVQEAVRFGQIFRHWADLVRSGVWDVDEDGVSTPATWFWTDGSKADRMLRWT